MKSESNTTLQQDNILIYKDLQADTSNWIEIPGDILAETPKALCFDLSSSDLSENSTWFPKSQIIILDCGDAGMRYFSPVWLWNTKK